MVSLPLRLWVCADPTITPNIHLPLASGPEYQCTLKQLHEDEVGVWQPQPSSGIIQIPTSLERTYTSRCHLIRASTRPNIESTLKTTSLEASLSILAPVYCQLRALTKSINHKSIKELSDSPHEQRLRW